MISWIIRWWFALSLSWFWSNGSPIQLLKYIYYPPKPQLNSKMTLTCLTCRIYIYIYNIISWYIQIYPDNISSIFTINHTSTREHQLTVLCQSQQVLLEMYWRWFFIAHWLIHPLGNLFGQQILAVPHHLTPSVYPYLSNDDLGPTMLEPQVTRGFNTNMISWLGWFVGKYQ